MLAYYKCEVCGYEHKMDHGNIKKIPKQWETTTCDNSETRCSEYDIKKGENPKDKEGHPKLPKKTAKLIKVE